MRKIILIQGCKNAGKSNYINEKFNELKTNHTIIDIINKNDWNAVIYILENNSNEIIILNSGSDSHEIINGFGEIINKYPAHIIYTAIRPKSENSRLYKWMIDALNITTEDNVEVIDLEKPEA